jgi:CheY-like chemotaxis protein
MKNLAAPVMLIVEDNTADVFLFQEALEASGVRASLYSVGDGDVAMKFLRHRPPYPDSPRPDIVVLDLNLPLMNGREVMSEMAADPNLRSIPVAILTTSTSEGCICNSYPGGCTYFTKTDNFDRLQNIIRQIARQAETK